MKLVNDNVSVGARNLLCLYMQSQSHSHPKKTFPIYLVCTFPFLPNELFHKDPKCVNVIVVAA